MKKNKEREDPDKIRIKRGVDQSMKERQYGEILEQNKPRVREFRGGGRGENEIEGGSEVLNLLWCNLGSRLATAEAKN